MVALDLGLANMPDETNNPASPRLDALLTACVQAGASDLHLSPGIPPILRIHGNLEPVAGSASLSAADMDLLAAALTHNPPDGETKSSVDGAISGPGNSRFRFNLFRRQGQLAAALRRLEDTFQTLAQLGLPASLDSLCDLSDGLVIVAGPTGAGKSTTLGTLLDRINRTHACHIVTIEDPVEYIHRPVKAMVNQRQVGGDSPSFNDALVDSLRQDPDVILVGEVRELATIRTAVTAAETGHLVFTTVHAGDCVGVIERLVSVFPAGEQDGIRRQLSLVLRAVVAQHLLPGLGGDKSSNRVICSEVLNVSPAVANLIATGKSAQIYSAMESGQAQGMQTLEQDLARLCVSGRISEASAVARARNAGVLRDRMAFLRKRALAG
jgi:twitching motility protein PilT